MSQSPRRMVDPRQPRFGQAITGIVLAVGFIFQWPVTLPVIAVVLGAASLLGPRFNVYAYLYRLVARTLRLGPPLELEESAPPRFANTLGFLFTGAATVAFYAFGAAAVAWSLGLLVSALALLAATTGLCVGCEAYVIARGLLTRGRSPGRIVRQQVGVQA